MQASIENLKIFDTLKYTKRAIAAGLTQKAAEFHAEEIASVINNSLVTKTHLDIELNKLEKTLELSFDRKLNMLTWRLLSGMTILISLSQTVGHFFK